MKIAYHAWQDRATVHGLTVRTNKGVVVANNALDIHTDQLTPVHLRLSEVFDQTLDAQRSLACTCGRGTLDHSLLDLITDSLCFFLCQCRSTLAIFTVFACALTFVLLLVNMLIQKLTKLIQANGLDVLHQLVVDLFPGHATILWIVADLNFSDLLTDTLVYEDLVYGIVLCDVAELSIAATNTTKVIKHAVQDLVPEQEL